MQTSQCEREQNDLQHFPMSFDNFFQNIYFYTSFVAHQVNREEKRPWWKVFLSGPWRRIAWFNESGFVETKSFYMKVRVSFLAGRTTP